ncbi:MAG TPA: hypothetical protein VF831_05265 [Anaerolineales bacterium]
MRITKPLFDAATHYKVVVQGRVDVKWLQDFDYTAEITVGEGRQMEDISVLSIHTDQSGIVGLIRRLHGLGLTIQKFQIMQS